VQEYDLVAFMLPPPNFLLLLKYAGKNISPANGANFSSQLAFDCSKNSNYNKYIIHFRVV
jgi:hypothetical protein